ncbi:MAG: flagellar basal body L-ring protein FlgH [Chromatiales bacterium]|nr:flagellar basal body L-ring protein FlgH [Chromatiales bacterium]
MKPFALLLLPLALLASGCSTMNARMDEPKLSRPQVAEQPAPEANGSIYQARQSMFLYEDARARNVGDILTVVLVERTQASKSASTSTSKDSSVGMAAPSIFGEPITRNGRAILSADIEGSRSFDGEGGSSQRNQLDGAITVVVVDVLPNGNLVVEGEKWIGINQGEEQIKVTGVVRPQDIQNDNSVISTKLGNANIAYRGKGALADANAQGWLSRFFNSPIWPF